MIYIFGWLTFIYFTFGNIITEYFTIWNLIIPNILTLGILIIYTKELLIGYKPKSKNRNLISLFLFSVLIIVLIVVQIPQFEILFNDIKSEYWLITLSFIVILTGYVGIIVNRILKINKL